MITEEQVKNALQQAVNDYGPDYVDPHSDDFDGCMNVSHHDDGSAFRCIAAEVLHILGVSDFDLATYNRHSIVGTTTSLEIDIEPRALNLLGDAQTRQDRGQLWGQIVGGLLGT